MHQKLQKIFSIAIFIFMTHAYAELHRKHYPYPIVRLADSQPETSNNNAHLARVLAFGKGTSLWQGYY